MRDILKLTLVVSVLLTIGVLARGSSYFGAFASPWTAVSLLPIVAVWAADRWQLASPRTLLVASIVGYLIALALPALGWGDETIFGWLAWLQCFSGLDLFRERHINAGWIFGPITIELTYPIACAFGAAANLFYLIAITACWMSRTKPRTMILAHRAAILTTILAVASPLPMCLTGDLINLYPGYGLWTASFLALTLSTNGWLAKRG